MMYKLKYFLKYLLLKDIKFIMETIKFKSNKCETELHLNSDNCHSRPNGYTTDQGRKYLGLTTTAYGNFKKKT